jgi:peptide/nickel transport system ATP-binding protein
VPSARDPPSGCPFHTRCPQKIGEVCERDVPALEKVEESDNRHQIACHLERDEMVPSKSESSAGLVSTSDSSESSD